MDPAEPLRLVEGEKKKEGDAPEFEASYLGLSLLFQRKAILFNGIGTPMAIPPLVKKRSTSPLWAQYQLG